MAHGWADVRPCPRLHRQCHLREWGELKRAVLPAVVLLVVVAVSLVVLRPFQAGTGKGGQAGPLMSAEQRAGLFQAGAAWQGRGPYGLSQADLEAFTEFSVLWLGASALGYNLQVIDRVQSSVSPEPGAGQDSDTLQFAYGVCTPAPGAERCTVPVTLLVEPACAVSPERVNELVAQLVGIGGTAGVTAGSALPAPDFTACAG